MFAGTAEVGHEYPKRTIMPSSPLPLIRQAAVGLLQLSNGWEGFSPPRIDHLRRLLLYRERRLCYALSSPNDPSTPLLSVGLTPIS